MWAGRSKFSFILSTSVGFWSWCRSHGQSARRRWTEARTKPGDRLTITFRQARGYLPSRWVSAPVGQYQIMLLGDRGTTVRKIRPQLLRRHAPTSVCRQDNSKNCQRILMNVTGGWNVWIATADWILVAIRITKRIGPTGILKRIFYYCGIRQLYEFCW